MDFWLNLLLASLISLLTAFLSIIGGLLLLSNQRLAKKLMEFGPYIAVVVISAAVFGDLIPEVVESDILTTTQLVGLIIAGFIACAIFGFFLGHFHHHNDIHAESTHKIHGNHRAIQNKAQAWSMLAVDTVHNAADGVMLGSALAGGLATGLAAALSIVAHEIPQEIGDFSIMLNSKLSKRRIIKLEVISAAVLVPVTILTFIIGDHLQAQLPAVLAFSAGFLLYIVFGEIICIIGQIRARTTHTPKK